MQYFEHNIVHMYMSNHTSCLTLVCNLYVYSYIHFHVHFTCRHQPCDTNVNAALHFFICLIGKLTNIYNHYIDVLKMSITVLLFTLSNAKQIGTLEEGRILDTLGKCEQALKEWVVKGDVIGGSFFGGGRKDTLELRVTLRKLFLNI